MVSGQLRSRVAIPVGRVRASLDRLYREFDDLDSAADPVHLVRRYSASEDIEIAGFCAAGLAFGHVINILASVTSLLDVMGDSAQVIVAGTDLGPGIGDTDDRPFQIGIGEADRLEHRPGRRSARTLGDSCTSSRLRHSLSVTVTQQKRPSSVG